jgi:protease-4
MRKLLALVFSLPFAAHAQTSAVDGVRLPMQSTTMFDGARALVANPAGLGFVDGFDFQLQYTALDGGGIGDGFAMLGAFRPFGPLRIGAGAQYLTEGYWRFDFGVALAASEMFSFGWQMHGLVAREGDPYNDVHSHDVGFVVRPLSWLSFAASGVQLNEPLVNGVRQARAYDLGLAFRPGTWRVSVAAEARIHEDSGDVDPRLLVSATPIDGLRIGVAAQLFPRGAELGADITASIGVDWSLLTGEVAAFAARAPGDDVRYGGVSVGLRITNQPRLSIHRPSDVWVEVALGGLPERPSGSLFGGNGPTHLGVVEYLARLAGDPHVGGVVLDIKGFQPNWAQARELRNAIATLQKSGKKVVAYFDAIRTSGYYALAGADELLVNPAGGIWLTGILSQALYFRDLLDWLGVEPQVARHGRYKSYPETFTDSRPSESFDEVRNAIIDSLFTELLQALLVRAGGSVDAAKAAIDAGPYTAEAAEKAGLVNKAVFRHDLEARLTERFGPGVRLRKGWTPENEQWEEWSEPKRIAVVTLDGSIVDGKTANLPFAGRVTGDESLIALMEGLAADPLTAAIVLRIDSPGGSALASDKIYRAIVRLGAKKPIVASMGSVAASGGYYAAMAAERVFAEAGTITGSIGIFLIKFSLAGLFDKVGLEPAIWKRGANADILAAEVPWTDAQQEQVTARLRYYYDQFVGVVAERRKMTPEQVDAVAQGRVWTGSQAKEKGLIDEVGGLREALVYAAERAGLDPYAPLSLAHYPRPSVWESLAELVVPPLPSLAEPGAVAPREGDTSGESSESLGAADALVSELVSPARSLLPFEAGEPLFLLPMQLEWE